MLKSIFHHSKKKGYTLPINILVTLILAAIVVLILIVVIYFITTSTSNDSLNTAKKVSEKIKNTLPFIPGLLGAWSYRRRKKTKSMFALKILFYLLLSILIATIIILLVMHAKDKGSDIGANVNNPSIKIECSQKCALADDFNSCYDNCIKETGGNKNENKNTKS